MPSDDVPAGSGDSLDEKSEGHETTLRGDFKEHTPNVTPDNNDIANTPENV